jgi:hypothetical protein
MLHVLTRIIKSELRESAHKHHTSMINDAISVDEHYETLVEIQNIIATNLYIIDEIGIESIVNQLTNVLRKYYHDIIQIEEIISAISELSNSQLREYMNEIELIELNRRDHEIDERIVFERNVEFDFPQEVEYYSVREGIRGVSYIVTGGSRISRGLTLEGLTISFFMRRAQEPNYDTMLQMARWCGYREGYGDLVRIITTPQIFEDYGLINEAEINMRRQIDLFDHDTDPVDSVVWIQEHQGLNVSGKMPLPDFITRITDYQRVVRGEIWTQRPPELSGSGDCNFEAFFDLFAQIKSELSHHDEKRTSHLVAKNVDSIYIHEFLNNYRANIENTELAAAISSIISEMRTYPRWNVSVATPTDDSNSYFNQNLNHEFKMVRRTPNSRNMIQQVYSNYSESTSIDLVRSENGSLEERTKPLIVFYLADNEITNSDNDKIYPGCRYPIPLFGILLPNRSTIVQSRQYVRGHREHNVRRPNFGGRNNE